MNRYNYEIEIEKKIDTDRRTRTVPETWVFSYVGNSRQEVDNKVKERLEADREKKLDKEDNLIEFTIKNIRYRDDNDDG